MNRRRRAVTLIELLVAIVMFGMISIGFASIELFARYQAVSSDRRSQILNEASIAVEAIARRVRHSEGWVEEPPFIVHANNMGVDIRENDNDPVTIGQTMCRFTLVGDELYYQETLTANRRLIARKIIEFALEAVDPGSSVPLRPYALRIHVKTVYNPNAAISYPDNPDAAIDTVVVCPSASMG
ncbi:MAG: type II secretion system protein [Candidatus Omnitrophica bacterium]|nr:type II secretion system protein [Candidatus Omnitrophota bacterium]